MHYHKLDLNVSYKFDWLNFHMETYLSLLNVYNRHNPYAFYPTIEQGANSAQISRFNQISLFPFIPAFGINMEF